MRITIARMRAGIVAAAILLVGALLAVLGFAHFERRRLVRDLPAKLGVHIQQSAEGFTYSQSQKGRTRFTIHASKVLQYKGGGRAALHDVSIVLYGNGDRMDRIYGSDFEYDPSTGMARAQGEVEIDLEAPATNGASAGGKEASATDGGKSTIHIKTSGLVFDRNTAIASTDQAVEFRLPQAAGNATGARYDSQQGLLVLDRAVEVKTTANGSPLSLRAGHAQFLRGDNRAELLAVALDYRGRRSSCGAATVLFRPDGSAERVEASGEVLLRSDAGQELKAQNAEVQLDARSQPQLAHLTGGVLFDSQQPGRHAHGAAREGTIEFGPRASLLHARMANAVTFSDEQSGLPDDPAGSSTRLVRASHLDVDFAEGQGRQSVAQHALAVGNAAVTMRTARSRGRQSSEETSIEADRLFANFAENAALSSLVGNGHTRLVERAADGSTQTSTGDSLAIHFTPEGNRRQGKDERRATTASSAAVQIDSALQQGGVALTRTPAPSGQKTPPPEFTAHADRASYTAIDQMLRLDGSPRIVDGGMEMTAQTIAYSRATGDAVARGSVRSTYQQGAAGGVLGGGGPAHIISDRANLTRSSGVAVFYGGARLWQGSNSIAAPVIELSQRQQTLRAHGEPNDTGAPVQAAFLSASGSARQTGVVRLRSQQLLYSEAERKATFRSHVAAEGAAGTVRSDLAEVLLVPAQRAPSQRSGESGQKGGEQSEVERLTASGHVVLEQPGRKGTGDRLVYTAEDGRFILTGSSAAPPRIVDQARGTITGDALIFNSRDDSVMVDGGKSGAVTETRVPR